MLIAAVRADQAFVEDIGAAKADQTFDAVGECPVDLPTFSVEVVETQVPVNQRLQDLPLAPEHRPNREAKACVFVDVIQAEFVEKRLGFLVVASLVPPATVMFDSKGECIIFHRIHNPSVVVSKPEQIGFDDIF